MFGAREVFILDGGFPKWKAEGRPIDFGEVKRLPRHFTARMDHARRRGRRPTSSRRSRARYAQVVDARSAERFRGEAAEPRPRLAVGAHAGVAQRPVPGAGRGRTARPARAARGRVRAGGVDIDKPIVTTCGSGVTAAILTFALDALGKDHVRLYDGSWSEWGARHGPAGREGH